MGGSRIALGLEDGALPGTGRILVVAPAAAEDLAALPRDRVVIEQPFRPDHDAWAARGYAVAPQAEGDFAAAVVCIARAREASRARIARAAAAVPPAAPVWVDGQKTDGIDSLLKELRARVACGPAIAKAHGKIAGFANPGAAAFAGWEPHDHAPAPGFVARAGVFSADGVDPGSAMLAAALPADLGGKIADLGAGWGWLSAQILTRPGVGLLHLVEADAIALDCARRNVTDPRARFHWEDVARFDPGHRLDGVVTNLPFHVSRAADPALGAAFIRAAARLLHPSGRLWLVANRHLPYEPVLAAAFRQVASIGGDARYKLLAAEAPLTRGVARGAAPAGRRKGQPSG